ncbi:efflux RND transporter periplasmic adaptor subunit [Solimonas sp. K1W22B-7]|uniref:efflux RND transporter periplasmic adaptor subunit n=1 Tax=Solimonas sp. K1W22B-7 TaxID=2303331 RepID=UPI000E3322E1|nr:efflux RND transporter periplasmic adaptor subunit [Solimonas sp. K1W22B-7]AXQ27912.1 efflux RND transporter periplasmic adaptor subunit [Solimonas sp. K1W22B-7]
MTDKSALLDQLRIDHSARAPQHSPWLRWALIGAALLVVALAAAAFFSGEKPLEITTATARAAGPGASASVLDASGYVVARRQATVSSKVTGKVIEVLLEEGRRVEAGQVLARIDDSNAQAQLALAQSQLSASRSQQVQVQVQLSEAERQLARTRELADRKLLSQQALDTAQANADSLRAQLETARQNIGVAQRGLSVQQRALDDTVVRAPFAGVITVKNAQPGEMISPLSAGGAGTRTGIGTLVDMDSLEIEVDVNENFINRVQPGQPAAARLNAYPDLEIPCEVIAVIPTADRSKATVKVRVGFKQKDPRVLPEMGVRVAFRESAADKAREQPQGVLVPAEAVQKQGDDGVVFMVRQDLTLERRAVKLGGNSDGSISVLGGLNGGERLAVGDFTQFAEGKKVKLKE